VAIQLSSDGSGFASVSHLLVTGATAGIGAAVVARAVAVGHRVTALGRRAERVDELAARHGAAVCAVVADVTDRASLDAAVAAGCERFGALDAVIANAGRGCDGELLDLSAADLEGVFAVNLIGVHHSVVASRAHWNAGARVVVVASVLSGLSVPRMGAYCATKYAVDAYASALRMELRAAGHHVASVHPGTVATEFFDVAPRPGRVWSWRPGRPASAERVARVVLRAATGVRRRRWWVPASTRLAVALYRIAPGLVEGLLAGKLAGMRREEAR